MTFGQYLVLDYKSKFTANLDGPVKSCTDCWIFNNSYRMTVDKYKCTLFLRLNRVQNDVMKGN